MHNPPIIQDFEELLRIARSMPKQTRTYAVTAEVADANYRRMIAVGGDRLRPMTSAEMQELADYLGIEVDEVVMAHPHIEEKPCPECARSLTFTDLIHEAVSTGRHDGQFMAEVLLGRRGHFVTISGTEDTSHVMRCLGCGDRSVTVQHGECYRSGCGGSYAHCAW